MKQALVIILALVMAAAIVACGTSPAEPEEAATTTEQTTETEQISIDLQRYTLPERSPTTQDEGQGEQDEVDTTASEAEAPSGIAPVDPIITTNSRANSIAASATAAPTTTTTRVTTRAATAHTTTARATTARTTTGTTTTRPTTTRTTTRSTTRTATTTTRTTTRPPTNPPPVMQPVTIQVSSNALRNLGQPVTQTSHMVDSIGRESTRVYTGVAIRNILAANGVNLDAIPANATLIVRAHDGVSSTLTRAEFMAPTTLLAWHEVRDGTATDLSRPRLVFPSGLSGRFVQGVVSIELRP